LNVLVAGLFLLLGLLFQLNGNMEREKCDNNSKRRQSNVEMLTIQQSRNNTLKSARISYAL